MKKWWKKPWLWLVLVLAVLCLALAGGAIYYAVILEQSDFVDVMVREIPG